MSINPIKLNIVSSSSNMTVGRSDSKFFQEVLGVKPFGNVTFNYDKWAELKSDKLFHNLTIEGIVDIHGDLQFVISGSEKPARVFAPTLYLSSDNHGKPQLSGGVSFSDHHFRGRGEQLQIMISQPDETGNHIFAEPDVKLSWIDNSIGKNSKILVGFNKFRNNHFLKEWLPWSHPIQYLDFNSLREKYFSGYTSKMFANLERSWYFQRKKIQSPKVDENIDFSANSITMNMGPYIIEERLDLVRSNQRILSFLSGVKTIFDFVIEGGQIARQISFDKGYSTDKCSSSGFQQQPYYNVELNSVSRNNRNSVLYNLVTLILSVSNRIKKFVPKSTGTNLENESLNGISNSNSNNDIKLLSRTQKKVKIGWGSGSKDVYHRHDITQERIIRRPPTNLLSLRDESSFAPFPSASCYQVYKNDIGFLQKLPGLILGCFLDIGLSYHPKSKLLHTFDYSIISDDKKEGNAMNPFISNPSHNDKGNILLSSGTGLSIRFRGIRFELAWPVFSIIKAVNIAQTTDIRYIYLKWKDLKKPVFYLEYDTEFI